MGRGLALALAAALAGCAATVPAPAPDPAGVPSRCGRYALTPGGAASPGETAFLDWWRARPEVPTSTLRFRGVMSPVDPDVPLARVLFQWVVDRNERRGGLFVGFGTPDRESVGSLSGELGGAENPLLTGGGLGDRLGYLRVEVVLIRALSWTAHAFEVPGPAAVGPYTAAPFVIHGNGEDLRVAISSSVPRSEPLRPPAGHGLDNLLGPSWGGFACRVTDAVGRSLVRRDPDGPQRNWVNTLEDPTPGRALAYPLRVELRVPERYFAESVFFDLEDLPVPAREPSEGEAR